MTRPTKNIKLGESTIPNVPFIWYREEEMMTTSDICRFTDYDTFINTMITSEFSETDIDEIKQLVTNNTEFSISIQHHVLEGSNIYVSYHSYIYSKHMNNDTINEKYNENFKFAVLSKSANNTIKFNHLNKNKRVNGSVHIHNQAFSPAGDFNFNLDHATKTGYLLTDAKCLDFPNTNILSLFIIINSCGDTPKINLSNINNKMLVEISDNNEYLINLGYNDKMIESIQKNNRLSNNLKNIYDIANNVSDNLPQFKEMFYVLGEKYNFIENYELKKIIIEYIIDGSIDSKQKLLEGVKYVNSVDYYNIKQNQLIHQLDNSIGFGIIYTELDIRNEVVKYIKNNNITNMNKLNIVIQYIDKQLKWANEYEIKNITTSIFNESFKPIINQNLIIKTKPNVVKELAQEHVKESDVKKHVKELVQEHVKESDVEEPIKELVQEPIKELVQEPIKESDVGESDVGESDVGESDVGESVVEEPVKESGVGESAVEESAVEESAVEEPIKESDVRESAVEESAVEEPIKESDVRESAVEEPIKESGVGESGVGESDVGESDVKKHVIEESYDELDIKLYDESDYGSDIEDDKLVYNKSSEEKLIK
jgi:hypothetical protein